MAIGKKTSKFTEYEQSKPKSKPSKAKSTTKVSIQDHLHIEKAETTEEILLQSENSSREYSQGSEYYKARDFTKDSKFKIGIQLGKEGHPQESNFEAKEEGEEDISSDNENQGDTIRPRKIPLITLKLTNTKSDTDLLWDEIMNGVNGKNSGIPMGFNRLNKYIGLRKSIYTLIGAGTG